MDKKIKEIRHIIDTLNFDEILTDFQKLNFSGLNSLIDQIRNFKDYLENKKINSIEEIEKKANKIKYIYDLYKYMEKEISKNYFYKTLKEKNMKDSLFENIIYILDDEKNLKKRGGKKRKERKYISR